MAIKNFGIIISTIPILDWIWVTLWISFGDFLWYCVWYILILSIIPKLYQVDMYDLFFNIYLHLRLVSRALG